MFKSGGATLGGLLLVFVITLVAMTGVSCANPYGYSYQPTPDTVTLFPTAGPVAESAFSSTINAGLPVGPVLTLVNRDWEGDEWKLVESYNMGGYTIPFLEATKAADVRMLVCIKETREKIGYYGGLGDILRDFGYRLTWDIRLVLWPSGDVIGGKRLVGGDPPPSKTGGGSAYGSYPTAGLRELLAPALLTDKTVLQVSSPVSSVAFSSDGKMLASGCDDGIIRLWDPANGQELRTITGHSGPVYSVAFSPDGKILASASLYRVDLWDITNGQRIRTDNYSNAVYIYSVAFSPDGKMLASGCDDGTIRLWDPANGQELRTIAGDSGALYSVTFSPDGKMLASASWYRVDLWDVTNGQKIRTDNYSNAVYSVAFSSDGKMLASGCKDGTIRLWDPANGQELRTIAGDSGALYSVAFSPDGKTLASSCGYPSEYGFYPVNLWDIANGQRLRTLIGHLDIVDSVTFSPDGKMLASGSADGTVKLWGRE
jgi:tricorn protease-like protein